MSKTVDVTSEVNFTEMKATTWRLTNKLRYLELGFGFSADSRSLQQMSQCLETGEERWDDVPIVGPS